MQGNNEFGKVPPQATDVEASVLGSLLSYPESINDVVSILKPEMFMQEEKSIYIAPLSG